MGKEDDRLLLFLSMEKPDLESCCEERSNEAGKEQSIERAGEGVAPSYSVFWTCVAAALLILSLISGVFQFCPNSAPHATWIAGHLRRPAPDFQYYDVPLRPVASSQATDAPSFSRGFDALRFKNDEILFDFHGQALGHDGRAYLTSQVSADVKGIVAKSHSVGRLMHSQLLRMKQRVSKEGEETMASFATTFVFSIDNSLGDREATGDGFAFVMVPEGNAMGSAGASMGVMDTKDKPRHTFAVEFDTWKNPSLNDISNNHVGINVNSMVSVAAQDAGYWPVKCTDCSDGRQMDEFRALDLTSGKIQAWIDYDGMSRQLSVSLSPILGWKPTKPLLRANLDLSKVVKEYMLVGFSAATGDFAAKHIIHSWQFEKSKELPHWRNANNVQQQQQQANLPEANDYRSWQSVSVRRDHGVRHHPNFRNPHRYRPIDSTFRPAVTTATVLPTEPERRPTVAAARKSCAGHFLEDFPSMDFPTFKEHFVLNSLWVLMGFASALLFSHLVFITYQHFVGCCDSFCDQSQEGQLHALEYRRAFEQNVVGYEKESKGCGKQAKDVGYVLVVSDDKQQSESDLDDHRPSARV